MKINGRFEFDLCILFFQQGADIVSHLLLFFEKIQKTEYLQNWENAISNIFHHLLVNIIHLIAKKKVF